GWPKVFSGLPSSKSTNQPNPLNRSFHRFPPRDHPVRASRTSRSGSIFFTASLICLPRPLKSKGRPRFWLHWNSKDLDFALSGCAAADFEAPASDCPLDGRDAPGAVDDPGFGSVLRAEIREEAFSALIFPSSSIFRIRSICSSISAPWNSVYIYS